jgi:site-specific DNA recombinase
MRMAVYVRVSTQQQAQSQTIEQQLERLQAHCQAHQWSWQEVQIFRDEGYSGATLRRPGLDRLRDQAASGGFDQVIITAPDRLARKYVHQMLLIEELEGYGCQVHFLERPMSEDPNDQLLLQIRGAVAEYERSLIAERMRRGRQHKYRAGLLLPWTRPPYGYRLDPDHPRDPAGVRVEAAEGAIVSELFARYVQPGQSLSSLSTHLKQLNVPTPTGKKRWSNGTLRRLLTNPVYTGVVYAGRGRVQPAKRRRSALVPVGQRTTTSILTSKDQWIVVGHIPALVTPEHFEQVQAKLKTNQQFARRNNRAHTYLLRALVSCGCCQLACTGQTRRRYSYYTCVGKSHPSRSGREEQCRNRLIPMKQLDALVWADLCDLLTHPEVIQQALQRAQSGEWLPQELQARREGQRKARVNLSHQIDRLTEAYLERIVTLEEYRRRRRELEERQEAIEAQMRQLEASIDRQVELTTIAQGIGSFCQRAQQGLAQATFEQKRHLVELLIDRVIVTQDEVEIRYVIPTSPRGETSRFYQLRIDYCGEVSPHLRTGVLTSPSTKHTARGA